MSSVQERRDGGKSDGLSDGLQTDLIHPEDLGLNGFSNKPASHGKCNMAPWFQLDHKGS